VASLLPSHAIELLIRSFSPQYLPGVPIEVAPAAYAHLLARVRTMGSPEAALRMAKAKAGPVVTDNGNFVVDAPFDPAVLADPKEVSGRVCDYSRL
jgi:ribose 5-phosphate isomerase A